MPSFGTDLVALATIAGSALVGGLGTFALLEGGGHGDHFGHHDMTVFPDIDHRIEIRSGDATQAILIHERLQAKGDRIERRRRHRHRHPPRADRSGFDRSDMVRLEGAWADLERQGEQAFQRQLRQELDEVRAKLAADQARFERGQRRQP